MDDNEFKKVVGEAIVSISQKVTGLQQDFTDFRQEFSGFRSEVNQKLDGIGSYLISSDKSHVEHSRRLDVLENRVQRLENEGRQDTA